MRQYIDKLCALHGYLTQASAEVGVTPGAGVNVATMQVVSGANTVQYQVVMVADESGHVQDSLPTYYYVTPSIGTGANKVWLDMFNATGSGKTMDIRGLWISPNATVAVTGTLGIRLDLFRSNTVGTGGTAATFDAAAAEQAGGNIWRADVNDAAIPAQVTARVAPTGGATANCWLFSMQYFPEETNAAITLTPGINWIPTLNFGKRIVLREGFGLKIVQGAVASVGNASILIAFSLQ